MMHESKLLRAFRALVASMTDKYLLNAIVRYRVVSRVGDRYNLKAVRKGAWPDTALASVMPGAAGYKGDPQPESIVLVQFLEGDESLGRITHFAGPNDDGFIPVSVEIAGNNKAIAGVGDQVTLSLPPAMPVVGLMQPGDIPFAGTITIPGTMLGLIQTGSTKAKVGA